MSLVLCCAGSSFRCCSICLYSFFGAFARPWVNFRAPAVGGRGASSSFLAAARPLTNPPTAWCAAKAWVFGRCNMRRGSAAFFLEAVARKGADSLPDVRTPLLLGLKVV